MYFLGGGHLLDVCLGLPILEPRGLECGEDAPLDVEGPGVLVGRGTERRDAAALEGEGQVVVLQGRDVRGRRGRRIRDRHFLQL